MATRVFIFLAIASAISARLGPPHRPPPWALGGPPPAVVAGPHPLPWSASPPPAGAPPALGPNAPPIPTENKAGAPQAGSSSGGTGSEASAGSGAAVGSGSSSGSESSGSAPSSISIPGSSPAPQPAPVPGSDPASGGSGPSVGTGNSEQPRGPPWYPGGGNGGNGPASGGYPGGSGSGSGDSGNGGESGTDGDGNPFSGASGGQSGQDGSRFGGSGFSSFLGFDIERAMSLRSIHGILAVVAFVAVFPLGAIIMRIVPGRLAVWLHALVQVVGFATYIAAAGIGIYLTKLVNIRGTNLLNVKEVNFHLIIGLVVLAALFLQPLFGLIHHIRYRKLRRRQVWSHFHLWIGRIFVTLGIINGGLGLWIANANSSLKIAYGVVAGLIWFVWMLLALASEIRRVPPAKKERERERRRPRV